MGLTIRSPGCRISIYYILVPIAIAIGFIILTNNFIYSISINLYKGKLLVIGGRKALSLMKDRQAIELIYIFAAYGF